MHLYLNSENPNTLKKAGDYLKSLEGNIKIVKENALSLECSADLIEDDCSALLERLLDSFADLNITGVIISDVPGRDRSFWNTETYTSAKDESGRRYFERESRTDWA